MSDLEELADASFQTIVDLAQDTNSYDEATWVKQLALSYQAIPVNFKSPTTNDFLRFLNFMNLQQEKQVFVHCEDSHKSSVFVGLYLVMTGQLEQEEGMNLVKNVWFPEPVWEAYYYDVLSQFYKVKQEVETI